MEQGQGIVRLHQEKSQAPAAPRGGDCRFAENQCARFMSSPGPSHVAAARRILRYLAGTRSLEPRVGTYSRAAVDPALEPVGHRLRKIKKGRVSLIT